MIIGIDFDNTIANYTGVFYQVALEKGLIHPTLAQDKTSVRDFFRSKGQEETWTILQGLIYGKKMDLATPFPHIYKILQTLEGKGHTLYLISHKTKYPYLGPKYDLHASARKWLEKQPFFSFFSDLFFELTLQNKLSRIETQKCDFFIDDLPEVLMHEDFPKAAKGILFDSESNYQQYPNLTKIVSWSELPQHCKS
jgi:hypothetical protein